MVARSPGNMAFAKTPSMTLLEFLMDKGWQGHSPPFASSQMRESFAGWWGWMGTLSPKTTWARVTPMFEELNIWPWARYLTSWASVFTSVKWEYWQWLSYKVANIQWVTLGKAIRRVPGLSGPRTKLGEIRNTTPNQNSQALQVNRNLLAENPIMWAAWASAPCQARHRRLCPLKWELKPLLVGLTLGEELMRWSGLAPGRTPGPSL